ncbi:hypothetical protein FACS189421_09330 [Bacteroidia bacterium]|nr:hypothetical protein FACS189421_09330 [Bacteroidia bacterium]
MTCGAQTYDVVIFDDMACLNGGAGFNMCPKKIQDELYAGDGAFLFRDDAGWRISKENIMYGNGGAGYGESKKCKINRGYNFNEIEAMLANLCGLRT